MKISTLFFTVFTFTTVLSQSACATKAIPQPPYSVEQLTEFSDKDEMAIVESLNHYVDFLDNGVSIFNYSQILTKRLPMSLPRGLRNVSVPAGIYHRIYFDGGTEIDSDHRTILGLYKLGIDSNGYIASLTVNNIVKDDIAKINSLSHLQSLQLYGSDSKTVEDVDLDQLTAQVNLNAFSYSAFGAYNISSLCKHTNLQFVEINRAKVVGNAEFNNCLPKLNYLTISIANGKEVIVKKLPRLEYLRISNSTWDNVTIEGATLPKVHTMNIGDLKSKTGTSNISFPPNLESLYLMEASSSYYSDLVLPDSLLYLDLKDAKLDDYSFIKTAKNLKYLNLEASNFNDWAILKDMAHLEYVNANKTPLSNAGIVELAQVSSLLHLSISDTEVDNLLPLASLTHLNYLQTGYTQVAPVDFPYLDVSGYIGFPGELFYNQPDYPEPIVKMKANTTTGFTDCFKTKKCFSVPWIRVTED